MFPETIKLVSLLAVVPASSTTAERSFSCLRKLKTWLRSTTTQVGLRLNILAILTAHRDYDPNIDDVLGEFTGLTLRCPSFFWYTNAQGGVRADPSDIIVIS